MEENKTFTYEIGGKKYIQRKLVFGQIRQLGKEMSELTISLNTPVQNLLGSLISGDKIAKFFAIVLTPDGVHPKNKDIEALAAELEFDIDIDLGMKVIEDFFDCNPIQSVAEKIAEAIARMQAKIAAQMTTGLKISSVLSSEATSPNETKYYGASDPTTSAPISDTVNESNSSANA